MHFGTACKKDSRPDETHEGNDVSQVGPKRRTARQARMQVMLVTARLYGIKYLDPLMYARPTAKQLAKASYYLDTSIKGIRK